MRFFPEADSLSPRTAVPGPLSPPKWSPRPEPFLLWGFNWRPIRHLLQEVPTGGASASPLLTLSLSGTGCRLLSRSVSAMGCGPELQWGLAVGCRRESACAEHLPHPTPLEGSLFLPYKIWGIKGIFFPVPTLSPAEPDLFSLIFPYSLQGGLECRF